MPDITLPDTPQWKDLVEKVAQILNGREVALPFQCAEAAFAIRVFLQAAIEAGVAHTAKTRGVNQKEGGQFIIIRMGDSNGTE